MAQPARLVGPAWKRKDRAYRDAQNAKARANRDRKAKAKS